MIRCQSYSTVRFLSQRVTKTFQKTKRRRKKQMRVKTTLCLFVALLTLLTLTAFSPPAAQAASATTFDRLTIYEITTLDPATIDVGQLAISDANFRLVTSRGAPVTAMKRDQYKGLNFRNFGAVYDRIDQATVPNVTPYISTSAATARTSFAGAYPVDNRRTRTLRV